MSSPPDVTPATISLRHLHTVGSSRLFLHATRIDHYHAGDVAAFRRVAARFRPEDHLLWMTFWHADRAYFDHAATLFRDLPVPLPQIWVLGNTEAETEAARAAGFSAAWVNHNAWLDEHLLQPRDLPRAHRALMVAQRAPYKRIHLAAHVPGLALAPSSLFPRHEATPLDGFADLTVIDTLPDGGIADLIATAGCGLILSEEEGACYASSEYLLCGRPVVSTPSRGGRDVFYDATNACIVDPDPDAVARGVEQILTRTIDPWSLHRTHAARNHIFRARFARDVIAPILTATGSSDHPLPLAASLFRPKMITFLEEPAAHDLLQRLNTQKLHS
jgi:hypothetical protein